MRSDRQSRVTERTAPPQTPCLRHLCRPSAVCPVGSLWLHVVRDFMESSVSVFFTPVPLMVVPQKSPQVQGHEASPVCSKHVVASPVHLWSVCTWCYVRVQRRQHPVSKILLIPGGISAPLSAHRATGLPLAVHAGLCASYLLGPERGADGRSSGLAPGRSWLCGPSSVAPCRVERSWA